MIHPRNFLLVAAWLSTLGHAIPQVTDPTAYDPELAANYSTFLQTWHETLIVEATATSPFYSTPANFSVAGPAGELLKLNLVNNSTISAKYQLPAGSTLWRIMYTSTDLKNQTVPASGYVLAPYTPTGKTVVWTHGTSGITRDCAPSNDPGLQYSWSGPFLLASLGYTVVAPDYAGEGTDTVFNYLAGTSHAHDASFALKAARAALPQLAITEWAVVGHSEGGITAWATNERESVFPTGGFLGAVSLAPAMDPQEIMYRTFNVTADRDRTEENGSGFYTIHHFETCRRFSGADALEPSDCLTPYGMQLRELNLHGGCYPGAFSILAGNNLTRRSLERPVLAKQYAVHCMG
jgi:dienelactone hydrolase